MEDIAIANAAVKSLKDSAKMTLKLWKFRAIDEIITICFSDCAGPGSASGGSAQGAHVLCLAEKNIAKGELARMSPIR